MNLTILVLAITFFGLIIFDVYVILKKGKSESISAHIIRFTYKHRKGFFMGLITGVICGHLFWSMPTDSVYKNVKCIEVTK